MRGTLSFTEGKVMMNFMKYTGKITLCMDVILQKLWICRFGCQTGRLNFGLDEFRIQKLQFIRTENKKREIARKEFEAILCSPQPILGICSLIKGGVFNSFFYLPVEVTSGFSSLSKPMNVDLRNLLSLTVEKLQHTATGEDCMCELFRPFASITYKRHTKKHRIKSLAWHFLHQCLLVDNATSQRLVRKMLL